MFLKIKGINNKNQVQSRKNNMNHSKEIVKECQTLNQVTESIFLIIINHEIVTHTFLKNKWPSSPAHWMFIPFR